MYVWVGGEEGGAYVETTASEQITAIELLRFPLVFYSTQPWLFSVESEMREVYLELRITP